MWGCSWREASDFNAPYARRVLANGPDYFVQDLDIRHDKLGLPYLNRGLFNDDPVIPRNQDIFCDQLGHMHDFGFFTLRQQLFLDTMRRLGNMYYSLDYIRRGLRVRQRQRGQTAAAHQPLRRLRILQE